jgi:hypothetical protein
MRRERGLEAVPLDRPRDGEEPLRNGRRRDLARAERGGRSPSRLDPGTVAAPGREPDTAGETAGSDRDGGENDASRRRAPKISPACRA